MVPASALATPPGAEPAPAATEAPRVLLLLDRPNDGFAERVRAELAELGLAVLVVETWRGREPVGPLEAEARAQQALAAIRILPSRQGVEVWMADETSGRSLLRQLVVDEAPGGPNEGLVALQTAELFRTSLLSRFAAPSAQHARTVPETGAGPPGVTPGPAVPAPKSAGAELGFQLGAGALFSGVGKDASFQALLSVHRSIAPHLAVAVDLCAPLNDTGVSGPEGTAHLRSYVAGLALLASRERGNLYGVAGVGLAAVWLSAEGEATAPLVARSSNAVTGAAYARLDGGLLLTRWLGIVVRGLAGVAFERVAVSFAGNDAGGWGRPFAAAYVLADFRWR